MIKLNDLAIGYNGEAILEHIDQEFDDGLIYGILAKSGAGKTTLLKTISGLLHPVHGEVVIDGTTYRNADKNPVYMMHQRYSNFGWLSCTENVLIAQRDKKLRSRDDAIKVLAAVGLEQYADKWPSQLSDGAIIQVEGNINARNYSDSGQALSAERAKAVAKYFIACGIDPNRLITVGNGNTKMVADPGSADAYLNRRTDVFFKIIEE